ncbi:FGGY-family carbohydrate kinase [Nonomuraea sp. NPDC050663]|uniref:FGGY-family carbohydrate kinase n=1 Tax=Nonomuraea sp. NPDC050663 TaxID=3364370 RepID=UPI00378C9662
MSTWMGIDIGTQSVRAILVTADGEVAGMGSRALTGRREGPRHEQDPEQWWEAVALACRQATGGRSDIEAVAVDATSGTVLLTDDDGRPVSPALMYDDTRAAAEVEAINDRGAGVWAELGYLRMQASWALPKAHWLLEHHGHGRVTHQSDFVNRRLTGHEVATDLSNALKTGAHLIEERWPYEALGLPGDVLPDLVRSGTMLGVVCERAAGATGIPAGTPVIAGMTDGCAAQLGAGGTEPGSWNSVLGTTLVIKGVTRELLRDPLGAVYSHRSPTGTWLPGGASSTGSGVIARDFADPDRLSGLVARTDVLAYPLLGRGERFPFVAPEAEAFMIGEPRDEAERFAAVLQGVGFVERLCFDYLDLLGAPGGGRLTLTGGAARNRYWCRLRADILGRPVTLLENAEPALGMAILAAGEHGGTMARVRETIDPEGTGRFDEPYLRLVEALHERGWLPDALAAHAEERTSR